MSARPGGRNTAPKPLDRRTAGRAFFSIPYRGPAIRHPLSTKNPPREGPRGGLNLSGYIPEKSTATGMNARWAERFQTTLMMGFVILVIS